MCEFFPVVPASLISRFLISISITYQMTPKLYLKCKLEYQTILIFVICAAFFCFFGILLFVLPKRYFMHACTSIYHL